MSTWKVTITQKNDKGELETITSPFADQEAATSAALAWDIFEDVETVTMFDPEGNEVELP